ncbi:MAG: DUF6232 family protein [Cyanobacteria bacterium P01_C01_bin.89]
MSSGQSLQAQLNALLPQVGGESEGQAIKTSVLKIVHNTVVFENKVYQIRNICVAELADLTRTFAVNQTVPSWYWFLVALGVILLFAYGIGIFILAYVGYLFWQHSNLDKSRTIERYGLRLGMNSGEEVILASSDKDFVLKIILTLYDIMNTDTPKAVSFNFETLNMEDRSINIEEAYGSTVVSGQVGRDVVNTI